MDAGAGNEHKAGAGAAATMPVPSLPSFGETFMSGPTTTQHITQAREQQRSGLTPEGRQILAMEQAADALEAIRIALLEIAGSLGFKWKR
jgi:ribonuclease D